MKKQKVTFELEKELDNASVDYVKISQLLNGQGFVISIIRFTKSKLENLKKCLFSLCWKNKLWM